MLKWAEICNLVHFTAGLNVKMNSGSKSVNSSAIKAEVKRHEAVKTAINRLFKQIERVEDPQLRCGLKVYLHSIQGKFNSNSFSELPSESNGVVYILFGCFFSVKKITEQTN